ncbi:hypothetical protein Leryth_012030 [Lithospermum erythrorhizon]|nr:hypothetical protein Leryth_012030 [Lithospermum erythrorhizon]
MYPLMKKICELCKKKAEMYCESDKAFLCCACDALVHSANFIVARHLRNLLCHVCMSVTEWTSSGRKLGPAASVCRSCVVVEEDLSCTDENNNNDINNYYDNNDDDHISYDDDDDDDGDGDDESVSGVESDDGGGDEVAPPWSTAKKRETEEESTSEESTNGQQDDDEVSTKTIIPPPSTTIGVGRQWACEESHGGEKEECVVETSTTSTNSVKTTKCRRV